MKKVYFTVLNLLVILSTLCLVCTTVLFPKVPSLMTAKAVAVMKEKDFLIEDYELNEDGTLKSATFKTNS